MVLSSLPLGEMGVLESPNCVLWRLVAEVGRRVRDDDRLVQRSIEGLLGLADFDVNIVITVSTRIQRHRMATLLGRERARLNLR